MKTRTYNFRRSLVKLFAATFIASALFPMIYAYGDGAMNMPMDGETNIVEPIDEHAPVHPDDAVKKDEHVALLELVRYATHRIKEGCMSCQWNDANSWQKWDEGSMHWIDSDVPKDHAKIFIPQDHTVVINSDLSAFSYDTIYVKGKLKFSQDADTVLKVDTMIVGPTGALEMGTENNPIDAHQAKIIIADHGDIDTSWDPFEFSRGLISHGAVSIHGRPVTNYVTAQGDGLSLGSTEVELSAVPLNWRVGDRLVIHSTNSNDDYSDSWRRDEPRIYEDEIVYIRSIDKKHVTFSLLSTGDLRGLRFSHITPVNGQGEHFPLYIVNLSRTISITSENLKDIKRRGHVMLMHSPSVNISSAQFYGLGRTNKKELNNDVQFDSKELNNDVQFDSKGQRIVGTGLNPRGRYSLHFHRLGADASKVAVVDNVVIEDSPGLGLVNHSSNVIVKNSAAYNILGSGFFTEVGDEIGVFENNIALRTIGSGDFVDSPVRSQLSDYGSEGIGFWFQGGGVNSINNVALNQHFQVMRILCGLCIWNWIKSSPSQILIPHRIKTLKLCRKSQLLNNGI